jgi:hypothetical protein
MLLGSDTGQRLEPVGKMSGAVGHSPILHGLRDRVGDTAVKPASFIDGPAEGGVNISGQIGPHHSVIKYQAAKLFCNCFHIHVSFSLLFFHFYF